jgi:hypothetical protein
LTALQEAYTALRGTGCGHGEALERLAVRLGVDKLTVKRTLGRAEKGG